MPEMTLREVDGRCRLTLRGLTSGHGTTLQEAADDLVERIITMAQAIRRSGVGLSSDVPMPDLRALGFLYDVAARAGDDGLREHLLRGIVA